MRARINRTEPTAPPIIGRIKIGEKSEKGYPRSTDYFIAQGDYQHLFRKNYGDKPRMIPVLFIGNDDSINCKESYEYRDDAGKLWARGDGECFDVWTGEEYKQFCKADHPDIMERIAAKTKSKKGWSVTLEMRFCIPGIPVFGHWKLVTQGNMSSIPQIVSVYDAVKQMKGQVDNTLFDLSVDFAKSQKPGKASRYPVITLTANADPERIAEIQSQFINNQKLLQ